MQKTLGLRSLINPPYKEHTPALVTILYNLNKAGFLLKIIFKDTNKPKPTIIDKIRKAYIKNEIIQRII